MYNTGQYDYQILVAIHGFISYFSIFFDFIKTLTPFIVLFGIAVCLYIFIRTFTVFRGK